MFASLRLSWIFIYTAFVASAAYASGLEANLDRYEIMLAMDSPTVIAVTLRNTSPASIYLTGLKVQLSEGAHGDIYNPALLHERLFRLDPGHSWGGPLVVVKPNHRGPLLIKGVIQLIGGSVPDSVESIASIPLHLTIEDPRRELDGRYDRGAVPACTRSIDHCCDPSERNCYQIADRCIYVAEGYGRQQVCINHGAGKSFERITDLVVSSDGAHVAYLANFQCLSGGSEIHCKRTVVFDHVERPGPGVATRLDLAPDGQHYAYIARGACVLRFGGDACSGSSRPVVDGAKVDRLPAWYRGP